MSPEVRRININKDNFDFGLQTDRYHRRDTDFLGGFKKWHRPKWVVLATSSLPPSLIILPASQPGCGTKLQMRDTNRINMRDRNIIKV